MGPLTTDHAVDVTALHPPGVLDRMRELYDRELERYVDPVTGLLRPELAREIPCPLCGSSSFGPVFVSRGFEHVRCSECSLVYVNPRLTDEAVAEQYNLESYDFAFENLLMKSLDYRKRVVGRRKMDTVARYFPEPGRILDIGCGLGEFLSNAHEDGWETHGIEFNAKAAQHARDTYSLKVYESPIEKAEGLPPSFDAITLWGVLEHLTDPLGVLRRVRDILSPGGMLFLEVPNHDSITVRFIQAYPELADRVVDGSKHLILFTRDTMEAMFRRSGFELVEWEGRGLDMDTVLGYARRIAGADSLTPLLQLLEENRDVLQATLDEVGCADLIRYYARPRD